MNLIFDGNYLFYKTLFIFGQYGSKGEKVLSSEKDQSMFMRKIATDMAHAIRTFGNPTRVVFTIDSRSWRKEVEIEEGGYKSNRDKDESVIDWDTFYKLMNEFGEIIAEKGYIVSREPRAEGDDLMYLWADEFFNNGEDSVIITGDKDMYQVVKCNNVNFIAVYNPNSKTRKIVGPTGFTEWVKSEEYDLFDASTFMNRSKDLIQEALNSVVIEEVNPHYHIFEKIICGDGGDAVPPVWTWEAKGKTYRVTPAKAARIYEVMEYTKPIGDVFDLPNRAIEVANGINATFKQNPPVEALKSRIIRNITLMYLDKKVIPQDIQDSFTVSYNKVTTENEMNAQVYDMAHILEGTRFLATTQSFEADIFSKYKF